MSFRLCAVGKSTKKISSNRPLRTSSGGRRTMSLAVATTKDGFFAFGHPRQKSPQHPARQSIVIILHGHAFFDFVPTTEHKATSPRRSRMPFASFFLSLRSICYKARRNPVLATGRRRFQPSPWPQDFSRNLARRAIAGRVVDQGASHCHPRGKKSLRAFNHSRNRRMPPISENFAVSYSNDNTLSRSSNSYFARMTSGISDSEITPSS